MCRIFAKMPKIVGFCVPFFINKHLQNFMFLFKLAGDEQHLCCLQTANPQGIDAQYSQ